MDGDTLSIRLLFDECIGDAVAKSLVRVLQFDSRFSIDAQYLKQWLVEGIGDEKWVPRARDEKRFVITADRGRKHKGPPLQILLPLHGVSGVFFTGGLHNKPQAEKARAVISMWGHIVDASLTQNYSRYKIGIQSKAKTDLTGSYYWRKWPLSEPEYDRLNEEKGWFPEKLDFYGTRAKSDTFVS